MKWLVFAAALALVYPAGVVLRRHPPAQVGACFLVGLLSIVGIGFFDINFLYHAEYRGDARGFEVTLLDLMLLAIYSGQPKRTFPSPLIAPRVAYLAVAVLSVAAAAEPLFAWFSVWNVVRMYFAFEVVHRACRDGRAASALLAGIALGVVFQFAVAFTQRYALGMYQTAGFFAHQNSLGSALILVTPPLLALVLARWGGWFYRFAVVSAALAITMSLSRGAMAILALQIAAMLTLSLLRRPTTWKLGTLAMALLVCAAIAGKAGDTIARRFLHAPPESGQGRTIFNEASSAMLRDHPLGIGLNQFSLVVIAGGYWNEASSSRPTAIDTHIEGSRYGGIAHNIYWLTLAELGYAGFLAFLWMLLTPLYFALRGAISFRSVRGDLLLGIAIGLVGICLQGLLEWTLRQPQIAYLFWILSALTFALVQPRETARRTVAVAPASPLRRMVLNYDR